ncbi:MAG: (deoxy)nucleoside triphosphate pyrophosphohydrolase [Candidatus Binatia bacterium]
MSPPSDPIHVSAGIVLRAGQVLACQRRADQSHPGKWEFPGGKREAGETMAACLRRELREELGIEAEVGAELWRAEHTYPGRPTVALTFFRVDRFAGEARNLEFAAIRWVDPAELPGLDFLDADRELIARLPALLLEGRASARPAPPKRRPAEKTGR